MRDKTKLENDADVKHAEMLIQKLFGETEHSSIFKQMIFGSMSHFKQITTYAIPFLMITWLRQLKESFFLQPKLDFFEEGMYSALSGRPENTTTSNNIWMSKNAKKTIQEKVESLAYFKLKQRQNVCATLREWAAYIFNCEFEPQTLDESSKDILNASHLKKKKYETKETDLNWAAICEDEAKGSKKKMTAIDVTKMNNKDLYLIVCEALKTGGSNTKRENRSNTLVSEKWNADITPSPTTCSFITRRVLANHTSPGHFCVPSYALTYR